MELGSLSLCFQCIPIQRPVITLYVTAMSPGGELIQEWNLVGFPALQAPRAVGPLQAEFTEVAETLRKHPRCVQWVSWGMWVTAIEATPMS